MIIIKRSMWVVVENGACETLVAAAALTTTNSNDDLLTSKPFVTNFT